MPTPISTLKLSPTRVKQAHAWRGARQRPKKIAPTPAPSWETFQKSYAYLYICQRNRTSPQKDDRLDDWLRTRWERWSTRREDLEEMRLHMVPMDFAFSLQALFDGNMKHPTIAHTWVPTVRHTILDADTHPSRQGFFLDAMLALSELRDHFDLSFDQSRPPGYGMHQPTLSYLETQIALVFRHDLCCAEQALHHALSTRARSLFGTRDDALDAFLAITFPQEQAWGNAMVERFLLDRARDPSARTFMAHFALTLLSTGADIDHITRLFESGALEDPRPCEIWQWESFLDLVIMHDAEALPLITRQLATSNRPDLNDPFFMDIAQLSSEPAFITSLLTRMLHHHLKAKPLSRLLAHVSKMPEDFLIEALPPQLQRSPNENAHEPLSKLLDNLQSSARARRAQRQNAKAYLQPEDLPTELKHLPWHEGTDATTRTKGKRKKTHLRPPALPAFWRPLHYPPLVLREDPASILPVATYDDIGRILTRLDDEALSPAIASLEALIDPSSLSDFCWHLVEDWLEVGAPSRQMWVFEAFLRFGTEELITHLPALIDFWIGSKHHQRGRKVLHTLDPDKNPYLYEALDAMRVGAYSDGATLAAERLEHFAMRHFGEHDRHKESVDHFLDAITMTHGLDASRRITLDPGSHVEVRLDADLEPQLLAPRGEEVSLSPTQQLRWQYLGRRLATQARTLARRLERAMCSHRRWPPALWQAHILEHPILGGLARRLIWATFEDPHTPLSCWRIDESKELTDLEEVRRHADGFSAGQTIGLVHPLHLSAEERGRWLEVLADFEIIQPFEQITRPFIEEPVSKQAWRSLYGKKTSYERLHDMFSRHERWEALSVLYMTPVIPGYGFTLLDRRGRPIDRLFKFELVDGIHKDPALRHDSFELEKCINLTTIKWEQIDPIERSELWYALSSTFCE